MCFTPELQLKKIGNGDYYGFELDGDGLFLLGDFTVTHNSSFIKYLAAKYRMPIMVLTFNPDWTNHDLLLIFAQIPKRCIVLMEDFDNYFNKRECIIGTDNKSIKFTFDIILNGLDGSYTTHEQVAFIMTVNDIDKVDDALKNRPSRLKFVREFANPDSETRRRLLPEEKIAECEGMNLDQILNLHMQTVEK